MKRTWQLAVHATSLHAVSVTWLGEIQASVRSLPSIPWRDHFFLFFLFSPGIEERIVPFFFFQKENRDVFARRKKQRWIWKKTRVSRVGMRAAINIVLRELF